MNLDDIDISKLPAEVRKELLQIDVTLAEKEIKNKAKDDFMAFTKAVWPEFIEGAHHRVIAQKFNDLATGKITRLIVNMPPRHTKSEFASFLLPAWMVGRNPKLKIIQATHTGELALRFVRKAKTLIDSSAMSCFSLRSDVWIVPLVAKMSSNLAFVLPKSIALSLAVPSLFAG